jgi:SAM-dependent methyltransferase
VTKKVYTKITCILVHRAKPDVRPPPSTSPVGGRYSQRVRGPSSPSLAVSSVGRIESYERILKLDNLVLIEVAHHDLFSGGPCACGYDQIKTASSSDCSFLGKILAVKCIAYGRFGSRACETWPTVHTPLVPEMFTNIQYRILKKISPGRGACELSTFYHGKSKLAVHLGEKQLSEIQGRTVIDFGCGVGEGAIEMALRGARRVIGIDIQEDLLEVAKEKAQAAGVADRCCFAPSTEEHADLIVSFDAFEHFREPAKILALMSTLLKPGGEVLASFGPTWYHPLGGHLFSVFPWSHLVFSEAALFRWRQDFKSDGATHFGEGSGGLNRMTIAKFEKLVAASPLHLARLELVPIRKLRWLHNRWTREFTTAVVHCRLTRREVPVAALAQAS